MAHIHNSQHNEFFFTLFNSYGILSKEGCNRGVACSLLKLGSLEKTIIASLVTLSCLTKKNQNLNTRKKSSVYYWKLSFQATNFRKSPFSIFLPEAIQSDHIRLLYQFNSAQNFLVVLGVVDMCHLLLNGVKQFLEVVEILSCRKEFTPFCMRIYRIGFMISSYCLIHFTFTHKFIKNIGLFKNSFIPKVILME